eukprot:3396657-Rhodomonas_salina.1
MQLTLPEVLGRSALPSHGETMPAKGGLLALMCGVEGRRLPHQVPTDPNANTEKGLGKRGGLGLDACCRVLSAYALLPGTNPCRSTSTFVLVLMRYVPRGTLVLYQARQLALCALVLWPRLKAVIPQHVVAASI